MFSVYHYKKTAMKRDGFNKSLWQRTPAIPVVNSSKADNCDILIAGGGITGLSLGYLLQKAGKKCIIAEAHSPGFGTTSGTTAHLNTLLDTTYMQIADKFNADTAKSIAGLTVQAIDLIEKNIRDLHIDCGFERVAGYTVSEDKEQEKGINEIYEGAKKVNIPVEYSNTIPVTIPFTKAIRFAGQAKFNPADYITGLAKAFQHAGGIILENCKVNDVSDGASVTAETSVGKIICTRFVWATHTTPGINLLSFRVAPYRSYVIAAELEDTSQEFNELVYDGGDPYHYYRMQKVEGTNYLIAGGEDHKTGHEENTASCFTRLEAHVRKFFKLKNIAYKWSSQYYEPVDGIPYIGILPGNSNIFTATGFGGNGMIYSAIAALILSEWLLTGDSLHKELFNPSRLKPVAGFTNFIKENADVVKEMVSGWFVAEKVDGLAALAPGSGEVVKYEGKKMGIFKDDDGKIYAVNTTCPHAGCTIGWNSTERSWDCPCHGARYNKEGKMLNGPAVTGLDKIEMKQA
jgi:glycine/D-amino acid oxidase-like deaminating enzyme/nitrite reductase/ring-hydroxylating ferredoxin subunit